MKKTACSICGKSRSTPPKGIPDGKRRVCWRTKNGMSWCGAEKLKSGLHIFVAQPQLPGIK